MTTEQANQLATIYESVAREKGYFKLLYFGHVHWAAGGTPYGSACIVLENFGLEKIRVVSHSTSLNTTGNMMVFRVSNDLPSFGSNYNAVATVPNQVQLTADSDGYIDISGYKYFIIHCQRDSSLTVFNTFD